MEEVAARKKLREVVEEVIVTKREPAAVVVPVDLVESKLDLAATVIVPDYPAEAPKALDSPPTEEEEAEEVDGALKEDPGRESRWSRPRQQRARPNPKKMKPSWRISGRH
jgi:hypothetical protein